MPSSLNKKETVPKMPGLMRQRLRGLSGRLPGYLLLLDVMLRRRSMSGGYSQALVREAGFGRMPVRVPGSVLPGFRRLGRVAVLGVLLHVLLRQKRATPHIRTSAECSSSIFSLREDAWTILMILRWLISGLLGKRTRLRSEV